MDSRDIRTVKLNTFNPLTSLTAAASLMALAFIGPDLWCSLALFSCCLVPVALACRCLWPMTVMMAQFLGPFSLFLFPIHALLVPGQGPVIWGLTVNLDGLWHAGLITGRLVVMLSGFFLLFKLVPPGTLLKELTARGLPWGPAYVICSTLQLLPRMKHRAATIVQAQQSRGLNIKGNVLSRTRALVPLAVPLVFGALAEVEQRALALELKHQAGTRQPTRYRAISDSTEQRIFRLTCLVLVTVAGGLRLWLHFN